MTIRRGGRSAMYDIVEGLHKALRIESTWAFVLIVALGSALVGGFFAWITETGYKNSAEYKAEHPSTEQAVTLARSEGSATSGTSLPDKNAGVAAKALAIEFPSFKEKPNGDVTVIFGRIGMGGAIDCLRLE